MASTTKKLSPPKIFDWYAITAQHFPAFLNALPILVLWYYLLKSEYAEIITFISSVTLLGSIGVSVVFLFFYAQLVRQVSKRFEKGIFHRNRGFPTTYLMLYKDNTLSTKKKNLYRKKVRNILSIAPPTRRNEEDDPEETQKRLTDITPQVLNLVRDRGLVRHHNIMYGFTRNFLGGTILGILLSLLNILIGSFNPDYQPVVTLSIVFLIIYLVCLAFIKPLLTLSAEDFAQQVFAEFLNFSEPVK